MLLGQFEKVTSASQTQLETLRFSSVAIERVDVVVATAQEAQ